MGKEREMKKVKKRKKEDCTTELVLWRVSHLDKKTSDGCKAVCEPRNQNLRDNGGTMDRETDWEGCFDTNLECKTDQTTVKATD